MSNLETSETLLWVFQQYHLQPNETPSYHMAIYSFHPCQGYSSVDFSDNIFRTSYELYVHMSRLVFISEHFLPTASSGIRSHAGRKVSSQVAGLRVQATTLS